MGNSDDDSDFAEYGTALEAIEEDDVSRKRPIPVSEQVAVDERGRRRFHGAFTGGFSAGYFNTVGSKEGWTPSTFKSSRSDRNKSKTQNALDFMDDEDRGAFGIAPQVLRPTDDFSDQSQSKSRKRPLAKQSDGPIPGLPVLDQLLQPVKETVGIKILIKMGWRPGKGVGPKIQRRTKRAKIEEAEIPEMDKPTIIEEQDDDSVQLEGKVYGCSIPSEFLRQQDREEKESSDEDLETEELLAPDDVTALLCNPKENAFGLGYKGLDRNTLTHAGSHVDLFGTKLKFRVDNKKMSISGQAFGVGAFEENDEDIYSREDMSQYDFALETPEERKLRKAKEEQDKRKGRSKENCIEGFRISSTTAKLKRKTFPPPSLPTNFQPFHATKKSRFELKSFTAEPMQDFTAKGLGRHSLQISERQVLIEDDINKIAPPRIPTSDTEVPSTQQPTKSDDKVKPEVKNKSQTDDDIFRRIERLKKFTQVLQAYSSNKKTDEPAEKAGFKPFMKNPEKQERYEKYLTLVQAGFAECLRDLQPQEMTEWERDREKMEFDRASKLYKPMNSVLSNRFVSAKSHDISHLNPEKEMVTESDPKDDPKVASRLKMFGKLTHRVMEWHPDKLVCKRFNIPHPYPDSKFVGVKGDPSLFARATSTKASTSSINVTPNCDTSTSIDSSPVPKKSLFDNLDFSKPPPGLLPPGTEDQDDGVTTRENAGPGPRPVLEFQKGLTGLTDTQTREAEKEMDDDSVDRPPIDLFKEIFADSSDSDDEEEESLAEASKSNVPDGAEKTPHMGETTVSSSRTTNRSREEKETRGIFDGIDLDKLHSNTRKEEEIGHIQEEDSDDLYGPLPPSVTSSVLSKPKAASDKVTAPVFYNRQRSAPDESDVVWVEKSATRDRLEKSKKHSSKKSKKKSSKKEKKKSHKKDKKKDHKKKSKRHKSRGRTSESSSSNNDSDASSDSSITLNDSLNIRTLQAKLKKMTKS